MLDLESQSIVPLDNVKGCLVIGWNTLKEDNHFELIGMDDYTLALKPTDKDQLVIAGIRGDENYQPLELCLVKSADQECSTKSESDRILDRTKYKLRVSRPLKGYLQVSGDYLTFIDYYAMATDVSLNYPGYGDSVRVYNARNSGVFQYLFLGERVIVRPETGSSAESFRIYPTSEEQQTLY